MATSDKLMAIAASLCLLFGAFQVRADLIVLQDGKEYAGRLLRATADTIVFERDGREESYRRSDVVHVRLQKLRDWDEFSQAAAIPDPALKAALKPTPDGDLRRYPGAAAVTLYHVDRIELRTPHTWTRRERDILKILKEEGERVSVRQFAFRKDVDRADVRHAVTIRPDGTVLHVQDTAIQEESLYPDVPRYDTMLRRRLAVPEGKVGNVFDIDIETVREKPLADQPFYDEFLMGGADPAAEVRLEITAPRDCGLRWQVLNDPDHAIRFTEQALADGRVLRSWVRTDCPLLQPEPMMPPAHDIIPRVVVGVVSGTWQDLAGTIDRELADLERRYPTVPPPPGKTLPELWNWVSRNLQELDVATAATGFVPGDPNETFRLRQGAALDRTYLLFRWLKAAGVPQVQWLWIRPRDAGRLAAEIPGRGAFMTPALRVGQPPAPPLDVVPGNDLDALPEAILSYLDAPALAAGDVGLTSVHADRAAAPGQDQRIQLAFDRAGNATVRQAILFRGGDTHALRAWRRLTEEQIRNQVQQMANGVDAKARDVRYEVKGDVTGNAGPLELILTYALPGFVDCRRRIASLKLPWLQFDAGVVGRSQRHWPLYWRTPRRDAVTVEILTPAGLRLAHAAEPIQVAGPCAQMTATLREAADRVTFSVAYERPAVSGTAADYAGFKAGIEKRAALGREYWIWEQK